jgi:lipopolysaccharide export system protein LptA
MKDIAFAAFAAAVFAAGVAEAQQGQNDEAIEVKALSGEFRSRECTGLFTGNVIATRGESRLTSDRLTMTGSPVLAPGGGAAECEPERLIAEGRVFYTAPAVKIGADRGEFDTASNTIVFTGDVVMTDAERGVMRATELVYNIADKSSRATANGKPVHMIITPPKRERG